jgi:hypothetical protein
MRNAASLLLATTFSAYLSMPLLAGILDIGKSTKAVEKHPLATLPELPGELSAALAYPRAMDAYIRDNFGLKRYLAFIPALKYRFVEGAVVNEVIVGKDRWLFYSGDESIPKHRGMRCLRDDEERAIASRVAALRAATEAHGGKFIFAIAPDKQSIYPEYLPSWMQRIGPCSVYDQAVQVARTSGITVVDLRPVLLAAKAGGDRVYHKTDTHWNQKGASIAVARILAQAGVRSNTVDLPKPVSAVRTGDLALMLNMPWLREEVLQYPLGAGVQGETRSGIFGGPSVLLIGDSFSVTLMDFFEPAHMDRPSRIHSRRKDAEKVIADTRPSIVILEMAERVLP